MHTDICVYPPACLSAPLQDVSTESREYEDMMTILTSSYIDTGSAGSFSYCRPRLVHSELLEKEVRDGWMDGWVEGPIPFKCVLLLNNYLQVKWHQIFENPSWCGRVNLIYISQYYKSHPLSLETRRKTSLLKGKQMKETSGNRTFSLYRTDLQQEITVYAVIMFIFKIFFFFLHFTFIWRGWEGGSHAAKVASQIQPGGLL